jgi:dihydroorotase
MQRSIIKGGTVIDRVAGIHGRRDIAVEDGRIAEVARSIEPDPRATVIDASGKLVTAGLIDLHVHVYGPGEPIPADPLCGVGAGVTSLVDAGSTGPAEIPDLIERVAAATTANVYCLVTNHDWPDGYQTRTAAPLDSGAVRDRVAQYPDALLGIKVAITPAILSAYGLDALRAAKAIGRETGRPVMLHIGDIGNPADAPTPASVTAEALALLDAGDILTHIYSPLTGGPLDEGEAVLPAVRDAQARGVVMDAAIGDYGFGWAAAAKVLAAGIRADTISSDIELYSRATATGGLMVRDRRATGNRVVSRLSLLEYMSYFLALGFPIEDVIAMSTSAPAKAAGIDHVAGDLRPGRPADIAVLEIREGDYALRDVNGEVRIGHRALVPVVTLKSGIAHPPGPGPHEWGFEPPQVH